MRRDDVLRILAANKADYTEFGVRTLSIFGSVARDEAGDASDVDILVDYEPGAPRGYFQLFALRERLEELLGADVDLVTVGGLRTELRDDVLAEAMSAAERLASLRRRHHRRHRNDRRVHRGSHAARVPEGLVQSHPEIPWSPMRAMRNVIVHEYFGVDPDDLWATVTTDLRPLLVPLRAMRNETDAAG